MKLHAIKCIILSFTAIVFLLGCKKKNESEEKFIGPIPESEFNSVPPPSYEQLIVSFESLTQNDPSLLDDNDRLVLAVFEWVKQHPNGELKSTEGIFSMANRLTRQEWTVLILYGYPSLPPLPPITTVPYRIAIFSVYAKQKAEQTAIQLFPCDGNLSTPYLNTKADAFRHAYWNILLSKYVSEEFAEAFTTAHESNSEHPDQTAMDLHNNKIGRAIAQRFPDASDTELADILSKEFYQYTDDPFRFTNAGPEFNGLIYIAGGAPFDGRFKGTMTNPDAGIVWNIDLDLNQCVNTVRGQYTITIDNSYQTRRFTGTIDGSKVYLTVAHPYSYEQSSGSSVCEDIEVSLSGDNNSLSGGWTSSNCLSGGVVTVAR